MKEFLRVSLVGRPNVGKSTVFNRLIRRNKSLVYDQPGVTRDSLKEILYLESEDDFYKVELSDHGGVGQGIFSEEIKEKVLDSAESADLLFFIVDGTIDNHPEDQDILEWIQKKGYLKKTVLVLNKIDNLEMEEQKFLYYHFGVENVLTISALHGFSLDDLKNHLIEFAKKNHFLKYSKDEIKIEKKGLPKVALIGRPNVGKSSLMNAFLQTNRQITSPIAGTTVDPVSEEVNCGGVRFQIIDTAGIRRKSKTEQGVEVLSVMQVKAVLSEADCALLLIDGSQGVKDQDEKLAGLILESGVSVILVVSKWDLQSRNRNFSIQNAIQHIQDRMSFLAFAPIVFTSAHKQKDFSEIGQIIDEVMKDKEKRIPTRELIESFREWSLKDNPDNAKFYVVQQIGQNPPSFMAHVNDPNKIHESFLRNIKNRMREKWGFVGSPIVIKLKKSGESPSK